MASRSGPRVAVFTIVSKNYLHFARVLMASLRDVHPDWEPWVLLADRADGDVDLAREPFRVVEAAELDIPEQPKFFFRYGIVEVNTAVKPWFFGMLFARGYDRVVFFDPDIFVYAPLDELESAWRAGSLAVLVPHLTGRIRDRHRPSEHDILLAGTYNLGFVALARHPKLDGFLEFWREKSLREFVVDTRLGLFTDQKWMDLVPGMFGDTWIIRHEGYDVAYWNLPHRQVVEDGGRVLVNGKPLVFFHFSGVDPAAPQRFSKHQTRYRLADVGFVADLVHRYCAALREHGYAQCHGWPYAYGFLAGGTPIPDELRRLYQACEAFQDFAGENPFALDATALNGPCDRGSPPISWMMRAVHHVRTDLHAVFPDPLGRDREAFARWFVENAVREHRLPAAFVDPFKRRDGGSSSPPSVPRRPSPTLWRRDSLSWSFLYGAARKAVRALLEGRLPWSPKQWAFLLRLHGIELAQLRVSETAGPRPLPVDDVEDTPASALGMETSDVLEVRGVTVVGYFDHQTGVAQAAHAGIASLSAAGLPVRLVTAPPNEPAGATHPVNLLYVNADQIPVVGSLLGRSFFRDRYNIAVWHWELDEFPDEYLSSFEYVDEIWAPSQFVMRSVAAKTSVPVVHMPNAVTVSVSPNASRRAFGLPDEPFLFLVMYDMLSVQERKNPLGAIEAFARAFPDPARVGLVVKINHGSSRPAELAKVREHAARVPGVILMNRSFSRQEVYDLEAVCDAYVSLHRSEGWGLNLCESMLLGKPVIATNWSANVDYMNGHNSCPVDYTLVRLREDFGPYRKGQRWADPDVDQAASYMTSLAADPARCRVIGDRARQTMSSEYSPEATGRRYLSRLRFIERLRRTGALRRASRHPLDL